MKTGATTVPRTKDTRHGSPVQEEKMTPTGGVRGGRAREVTWELVSEAKGRDPGTHRGWPAAARGSGPDAEGQAGTRP